MLLIDANILLFQNPYRQLIAGMAFPRCQVHPAFHSLHCIPPPPTPLGIGFFSNAMKDSILPRDVSWQ